VSRLKSLAQQLGSLGIAFVVLLILYLPLYFLAYGRGFTAVAAVAVYVTGAVFAIRLFRRNVRRVIWRLRNRLIVAYLFIAFVPIVLIGILVAIGGYSLVGQLAVYLVSSELDRRTEAMDGVVHLLAGTPAAKRENTVREVAPYIQDRFPDVELLIQDKTVHRYPDDSDLSPPPAGWKDASGVILKTGMPCSWAHVVQGDTEVTLLAPLTPDLLARLVPGIGEVVFLGPSDFRWKSSAR